MQILQIIVQSAHLLVIGVGVGLPLLAVPLNRKLIKFTDEEHRDALWTFTINLIRHAFILILLGSLLGLGLAGVLWSEDYHERCHLVMTKFKWAGVEWLVSMLILLTVYLHGKRHYGGKLSFWIRAIALSVGSFNLLYHLPILFIVIGAIPEQQVSYLTEVGQELSRESFNTLAHSSESLSRWIHACLALLAAASAYVAVIAIRVANQYAGGIQRDSAISVCRWSARNMLILLFCQLAVGIWTVIAMPADRTQDLLGGDLRPTTMLAAGLILLFVQLQQWTGLIGQRVRRSDLVRAVATFITMFCCMVAVSVLT